MDKMDFRLSEANSPKLTDWVNEPNLLSLKQDFETAKPYHDMQVSKIQVWNDLMQIKGRAKPPVIKGRSSVQPKLIRRQAEWRYSALTEPFNSSKDVFKVTPRTFEDANGARQNNLVLNWQLRTKLNRIQFVDNYVRSIVDEGTGIVQIGWKRATTTIQQEVPVYSYFPIQDQEGLQLFQEAIEFKRESIRDFNEKADPSVKAALEFYEENGQPVVAKQVSTQLVPVEKILENQPTLEIINPQNFYLDPSCNGDISKALFAIVSFETNQAELKKNPERYKNLDRVNWENNTPLTEPDHYTTTPDIYQVRDNLRKRVVAYEYWGLYDINKDGVLVPIVCTWIGDVIIRLEKNPFPDQKIPFVLVPYLPVKRELFGEPDAELLEDNQKILGALTRGMIDLLGRSANSQIGMAKGMLDPLNKRRFENGQDYEFNPNQNPQAGNLIEHKYPELPQSALMMLGLQNQEAEALTGVKSFSGGVSGESYGDVAAGIRGVLDAASKREMAILRRLAQGFVEIGLKLISMNAVFLSKEEVIRVTNQEFVTVNREELKGNFDLEVDISTAEIDNAKAQDLAFMLQTIGPNTDTQIVLMILADIADLKRMPELADKIRKFKKEPSPQEQKMMELAIQKLELENQELMSQIDLNKAKAEEARANKDQKTLDFVEQEGGTKHARDMQKIGGQARANADAKVTEAILKPRKQANGGEAEPNIEAAIGWNALSDDLNDKGMPGQQPAPVVDNLPQSGDLVAPVEPPQEWLQPETQPMI